VNPQSTNDNQLVNGIIPVMVVLAVARSLSPPKIKFPRVPQGVY